MDFAYLTSFRYTANLTGVYGLVLELNSHMGSSVTVVCSEVTVNTQ